MLSRQTADGDLHLVYMANKAGLVQQVQKPETRKEALEHPSTAKYTK